ncbi:MAG: GNAT family N-acetyltransferase [Gemmatimonadales bacterium]|nr:GNAT family N-acetyltransferase [Gemmatimonadales bacterium]
MPAKSTRSAARTTVREIVDPGDPALKDAYALLARTFHRGERVALRDWIDSLSEKSLGVLTDVVWHLLVAEEGGRVVGLASGTYLGNVNLGVIGYLAADRTTRSRGVGTRLRGHLRRRFTRDAKRITGGALEGIIGEVSADNPWLRALARRPEVLVLDFQYYQPRLYDDDEPSPFVLYYECLTRVRDRIPVKELRRILYTIWRRIYRVSRPVDRRAFRAMLRALENRRTIGRRRTSN